MLLHFKETDVSWKSFLYSLKKNCETFTFTSFSTVYPLSLTFNRLKRQKNNAEPFLRQLADYITHLNIVQSLTDGAHTW